MDYSKVPNPYDFANPVIDPELFAGRTEEVNDISYYLDHACHATRPINLAVMGERASGKTSVLNKIQSLALKRDFCVVRIDLDEGDARTQLGFFYKIFDALLTTAVSARAYGGLLEKTYQTYRNMVDALEVPADKTFCPFIFPFQYANALGKGNDRAVLSDTAFKDDISQIQREAGRVVLIIFDECDVLASSRIHLQKLRNIFMNASGFMLVFAGTPKLFPIMDDVFSPIVRQFKKINLGPFETIADTEKCVLRPLENIGIREPREVITAETVREIHDVSGGRPYEIQLICHFLFRRLQANRARRLEINVDVLDDVKRELEASQDVTQRPFLTVIRNLNDKQLSALHLLCAANNHATFEQLWFAEFLYRGEERWTQEALRTHLKRFAEWGIISEEDGVLKCAADDFDRIYCKYFARKRKVVLSIVDRPYDALLVVRLNALLHRLWQLKPHASHPFVIGGPERVNLSEIAAKFLNTNADPFESREYIARHVYMASVDFQNHPSISFGTVGIATPWTTVYGTYFASELGSSVLDNTKLELTKCAGRARQLGGDLFVDFEDLTPIPLDILEKKVNETVNANIRELLYWEHLSGVINSYIDKRDMRRALTHAEIAYRYNRQPGPAEANNLGYVFMIWGQYSKAKELFEIAVKTQKHTEETALPRYNLGVLEAKRGNYSDALAQLKIARELIGRKVKETPESKLGCLVVPKIELATHEIQFEEVWDPLLSSTIESAISTLEMLQIKLKPGGRTHVTGM